jgi:photosystem II stability/assembly factor-like uncharacterized protein
MAIAVAILVSATVAQGQWTRLTASYPSNYRISDVAVNDSTIIATGFRFSDFQGIIYRSFDNGVTWDTVELPPADILFETVAFRSKDTAYIGGFGDVTVMLRSVDGGHNWAYYITDTTTRGIDDMAFVDDMHGFAGGYDTTQFYSGNCYYTADGGNTWHQQTTTTGTCLDTLGLDYIDFVDGQTGYGISNFGLNKYLLKTTDTGKHWNLIYTEEGIGGVYFRDALNGVMVAEGGKVFKSSDGGMSWTAKTSPTTQPLFSVSFMNGNDGYAAGANGTIIKSTDGGETWTVDTSHSTETLLRVKCFNHIAYAVGDGGTILRSGQVLAASQPLVNNPLVVYPNPANTELRIYYANNQGYKNLNAVLSTPDGRLIRSSQTNQNLMNMNTADVPAGTYLLTIAMDAAQLTQKVIIQH